VSTRALLAFDRRLPSSGSWTPTNTAAGRPPPRTRAAEGTRSPRSPTRPDGLGFLGVHLDDDRNASAHGDADIGAPAARVRTVVVTAREDREIARQVRALA
jgi:hypothetical protein